MIDFLPLCPASAVILRARVPLAVRAGKRVKLADQSLQSVFQAKAIALTEERQCGLWVLLLVLLFF